MDVKVSVGICIKNCEEYIKEAIDSIVTQDYPHDLMELIFVDESEDNTLRIVEENISEIDIPAKVIHVTGKGLGYSRNLVVKNATGDYILWVDGDMVLSKGFIRKQVDFMENHPRIGIARGEQALVPSKNLLGTLESFSRAASRMVDYQSKKAFSKCLGTGGAIYRIDMLSVVDGFDENIVGYCEDWDLEMRAKRAGWSLSLTDAQYLDYERRGLSWKHLWSRYWRRGYYTHYFLHKNKGLIKHYRMFPPAAIIAGLLQASKLYKLTHQKMVFLLPIQFFYKTIAWYFGFINSHINLYQP